jgi:hypothetical protein
VNGFEYLQNGRFLVEQVTLRAPSGETRAGATSGSSQFDPAQNELTLTLDWGTIATTYRAEKNIVSLRIVTANHSSDTIESVRYTPLSLVFPQKVKEYDGTTPLLAHNLGQIGAVKVSYDKGTLDVASDDLDKPLMIGFPWALDRPANTQFPLSVHTGRVGSFPDSYPMIRRPIAPGASDSFLVTLRFGRSDATTEALTADLQRRFGEEFPFQLNWTDRRPIGAIFLATDSGQWPLNPRGWFGDSQVNVTSPEGVAAFRKRLLDLADTSIGIMKDMNAQGAITWDIEGQQFPHPTTYLGDPRQLGNLAPEMAAVADEYFGRFRAAGLRTGVTVRPQNLVLAANKKEASQQPVADPTDLIIDKISYAKKRWGVSMIYLDANVNSTDPNPLDVAIVKKVAATFPDILLIPEHSNLQYYAYSAPSMELRHGLFRTPETAQTIYPQAFSVIYTADGPLDLNAADLKASAKRGDALLYRTWYPDPQNEKVKAILKR